MVVSRRFTLSVIAYMIAPQIAKRMRHRIWRHTPLRAASKCVSIDEVHNATGIPRCYYEPLATGLGRSAIPWTRRKLFAAAGNP